MWIVDHEGYQPPLSSFPCHTSRLRQFFCRFTEKHMQGFKAYPPRRACRNKVDPFRDPLFKVERITTRKGQKIATMFIGYPNAKSVVIFSHGYLIFALRLDTRAYQLLHPHSIADVIPRQNRYSLYLFTHTRHRNATDIGAMRDHLVDLSRRLKVRNFHQSVLLYPHPLVLKLNGFVIWSHPVHAIAIFQFRLACLRMTTADMV